MFSNAVIYYDIELLETRPTNKLQDTPYRVSSNAYSVYYQLLSISGDYFLRRNLKLGSTVMTRKHLVRLMIHSNYHYRFYLPPVFLVPLTVLLKKFTP
jgi:hypothetical protein